MSDMRIVIGANKTMDEFSLKIAGMNAKQFDAVRILLKTIVDYSYVFNEADTSGIELKNLVEMVSKINGE